MKRIILLRHAKTENYSYDKDDFERNLTERGISDCHIIADVLRAKSYSLDYIISSPANRTKQTAKLFAKNFGLAVSNIQYQREIYDAITTQEMLKLFSEVDDKLETVLFVGHNPDISRFAYRLTQSFQHHVPTCCAIVLETDIHCWKNLGTKVFRFQDILIPKNYK